jgi:hypothetical protein
MDEAEQRDRIARYVAAYNCFDVDGMLALPELPSQRAELAQHIRAAQLLPPDWQRAALRASDWLRPRT